MTSARDVSVAALELTSSRGWPPLEESVLGGWRLRTAGGFTGRANSVLPLGSPGTSLDEALGTVVAWYQERGLPPQIQVPLPLCRTLDAHLARRGWPALHPARVLVADVDDVLALADQVAAPPGLTSTRRSTPDAQWLAAYHYRDQPLPPVAAAMMARGPGLLFLALADPDGTAAVGRSAVEGDWVGITAVEVAERARRRGLGARLVRDLVACGADRGARFGYLQVADESGPARALYARLGFVEHHRYHYRRYPG